MRKNFKILMVLIMGVMSSSCTHYIYNVPSLKANYDSRMTSPEDLEIKSKVKIFTSENDIKGDYELLSFNYWMPWPRLFPFAKPWVNRTTKRFYQKATQIAYQEGGNAIIITSPLNYKVIRLLNFDEESVEIEKYRSYVFDTKTMDLFKLGIIATMPRAEKKKNIDMYEGEIEANVSNLLYLPEVIMVREKIKVYNDYNNSLKHSKSSIEKFTKKQTKKLNAKEKKIKRMIAKNKIDSVFTAHTAICEQQLAEFYNRGSIIPPTNETQSQKVEAAEPVEQTKPKETVQPSESEEVIPNDVKVPENEAEMRNANDHYIAYLVKIRKFNYNTDAALLDELCDNAHIPQLLHEHGAKYLEALGKYHDPRLNVCELNKE